MIVRAAVAAVVVALLIPVSADALTYREQRAIGVAADAWGTLPCDAAVTVERRPLYEQFGAEGAAEAVGPCTIVFDPVVLPTLYWPAFCSLVVHEVGHLLGYRHSADPRSVMYPAPAARGGYWRCRHSRDWQPDYLR